MSCNDKLLNQNITSNCTNTIRGGWEKKGWIANRSDIENITQTDNVMSAFDIKAASVLYTINVAEMGLGGGHEFVPAADGFPKEYINKGTFKLFDKSPASMLNADQMDDLVLIVESKDIDVATGEKFFLVYGLKNGLWKLTDTQDPNADRGVRPIEMQSQEGANEPFSSVYYINTDYATTLADLVAKETNTP